MRVSTHLKGSREKNTKSRSRRRNGEFQPLGFIELPERDVNPSSSEGTRLPSSSDLPCCLLSKSEPGPKLLIRSLSRGYVGPFLKEPLGCSQGV